MDTLSASRSSRRPLWTALIAVVAMLGLAACSSSESNADDDESGPTADEAAATNDVASSTQVSLTPEFDNSSLEELLSNGSQVMVAREIGYRVMVASEVGYEVIGAREVDAADGQVSQLVWLSVNPLEVNQLTFDPADVMVFASEAQLFPGAVIDDFADTDIATGEMATRIGEQFEVGPGPDDAITVTADTVGFTLTTLGLAGSATVNGTQTSAPFVAASVPTNEMVEFSDTGRILVWVSSDQSQPGTVVGQIPPNATTIDTASRPNATLRFDPQTQTFELVS